MFTVIHVHGPAHHGLSCQYRHRVPTAVVVAEILQWWWPEAEGPQAFLLTDSHDVPLCVLLRDSSDPSVCWTLWSDGRLERHRCHSMFTPEGKFDHVEVTREQPVPF